MSPPNLSLIVIMACFWITFWLVQRFLIHPVGQVLAERDRRIRTADQTWSSKNEEFLSATSRLEAELADAGRAAAATRAEHRQAAQAERQRRLDQVREEADGRLREALTELEKDATRARDELRLRAKELAAVLAGRLLEREVKP